MFAVPFQIEFGSATSDTLSVMHSECQVGVVQVSALQQCSEVNSWWTLGIIALVTCGLALLTAVIAGVSGRAVTA